MKNPHMWSTNDGTLGSKRSEITSKSKMSADNGSNISTECHPFCKPKGTTLYTF